MRTLTAPDRPPAVDRPTARGRWIWTVSGLVTVAALSVPVAFIIINFSATVAVRRIIHGRDAPDDIVIRDRDKVHAALFQSCVQRARLVVGLQTNAGEHGYRAHSRMHRVNVEVAPHAPVVNPYPLQIGDFHTKQL